MTLRKWGHFAKNYVVFQVDERLVLVGRWGWGMPSKVAVPARVAVLSALRAAEEPENRMLAPVPAFEHMLKCGNDFASGVCWCHSHL